MMIGVEKYLAVTPTYWPAQFSKKNSFYVQLFFIRAFCATRWSASEELEANRTAVLAVSFLDWVIKIGKRIWTACLSSYCGRLELHPPKHTLRSYSCAIYSTLYERGCAAYSVRACLAKEFGWFTRIQDGLPLEIWQGKRNVSPMRFAFSLKRSLRARFGSCYVNFLTTC